MDMIIQILQFLLSLSLLVILHEFGHYITARIFKVRVEKFYIFFNLGFSLFKKKVGDTEYGIGWLPLGGYVKLSGMIDESMDTKQMKEPPKPWEFRSKPAWQRLIIMLAGIIMNIITAFLIYITIIATWGTNYLPSSQVKQIYADSLGQQIGLRTGDRIISVNGKSLSVKTIFIVSFSLRTCKEWGSSKIKFTKISLNRSTSLPLTLIILSPVLNPIC